MCVWRETASEGSETRETRDLHCHVCFCLGLLCERLSLVTVFVTRLRVSKFYASAPSARASDVVHVAFLSLGLQEFRPEKNVDFR